MAEQAQQAANDHAGHDRAFVTTFLAVLAVLIGITVLIVIIANSIDAKDEGLHPVQRQQTAERLAPIGAVYTDASQVAAAAPAADKTEQASAAERSTDDIVSGVCTACHAAGVAGAAKFGDEAAWQERLDAAGGIDGLVSAVIDGKGAMPPRAGDASLTDEQIRDAVQAILADAGL